VEQEQDEQGLTRREFLRRAALGAVAAAGAISGLAGRMPAVLAAAGSKKTEMKYRTLGRTKLRVSELGMGTIKTGNAGVIRRALDLGINFFDTAECYRDGNGEIDLGKALKGRREQAIVATKWHTNGRTSAQDLLASLDGSLRRLGIGHVDLVQIHGADRVAQVRSEDVWQAFSKARQDGKVRFQGFSTHSSNLRLIRAAIETGWYDVVQPIHNALTADGSGPWVAEAHQAGMGTIIMKALQPAHEGKGSEAFSRLPGNPYQRAIQWVLEDANVCTVIVDMPTFEELEQDCAAVTTGISKAELEEFEAAVTAIAAGTCHLCRACVGQCPAGVKVADIMRFALYHDGYGHRERAISLYRSLPVQTTSLACTGCARCRVVCPWGVPVKSRLEEAHARMA